VAREQAVDEADLVDEEGPEPHAEEARRDVEAAVGALEAARRVDGPPTYQDRYRPNRQRVSQRVSSQTSRPPAVTSSDLSLAGSPGGSGSASRSP
jgi:hypothetical protein